ncbi:transcriptional regulator [Kitasatospora herbaricolor]|uniref:Transcriptional regulator n=1 Tax=Kitasatospora herbaricolor TaxID=68217 RepID=A0ABZ1WK64_9ACTN|nr:transcriptional regulator [Kitasatospora herbaricolor]
MAGRWMEFGKYGAAGIPGWLAIARGLDDLVTGPVSPVTSKRGLAARVRYLTRSAAGYEAMARAGITAKPRTIKNWIKTGKATPANREMVDAAYWTLRRHNVVTDLKRRLNNNGAGTRVEIYPVDQSGVQESRRRDISHRAINVRGAWDDMVDAWDKGPNDPSAAEMLDVIWDEVITDLGSDYDAYSYVTHIGFAA